MAQAQVFGPMQHEVYSIHRFLTYDDQLFEYYRIFSVPISVISHTQLK